MLSEEKIKLMTKVAKYESGEGQKDLSIVQFHVHQYVKLETIQAFLINTIAYLMVLAFLILFFLNRVVNIIEDHRYGRYLFFVLVFYVIFVSVQVLYARARAIDQYEKALPRVREYKKDLTNLGGMYESEEEVQTIKPEELEEKLEEEMNAETIEF